MKTVAVPNLTQYPLRWAKEHCPSFIRVKLKGVTEESVSGSPFTKFSWFAEYYFENESDAVLFTLRWL